MIVLGKVIYALLSGDTQLNSYVSGHTYPVVAPEDTLLPFVVYKRRSNPEYSRDGAGLYTTDVEVTVIANNEEQSINIAQRVHDLLVSFTGEMFGIYVKRIIHMTADEDYSDGAFIQMLTFAVKST